MNVISHDERYDEDLEQAQYILKWIERKEDKKRTRRTHMDEFREVFRANTKN